LGLSGPGAASWNTRYSGKPAGGPSKPDASGKIYIRLGIDGVLYPAHRIIWKMVKGPRSLKRDQEIDHIDGNGQNNIIKNLRRVSHLGNHKNLKLAKNNKSGVTGVHRHGDKWKATGYKTVDGKNIQKHLGTFDTKKQAQNARLRWQKDLDYHELHGAKKYA
jgi:hypothetical protein